jgi:hypothetical protein
MNNGPCGHKSQGKVTQGGIMYNFGPDQGEQNQNNPEQDEHPDIEILI